MIEHQKALIPVFQLQNNIYYFTAGTHKFKSLFCIEKLVMEIRSTNSNYILFWRIKITLISG